ncbi:MAG TPA: hypothetical protein VK157_10915 [Phycisphaerales bacterium]|nr:hypothetical protein [Phycisphaerales bacterium]
MTFPHAIDLQIAGREAFLAEADAARKGDGASVAGHDVALDAVQTQSASGGWPEPVREYGGESFEHVSVALSGLGEPVADGGVLEGAARDVAEGDAADEGVSGEDEGSLGGFGIGAGEQARETILG